MGRRNNDPGDGSAGGNGNGENCSGVSGNSGADGGNGINWRRRALPLAMTQEIKEMISSNYESDSDKRKETMS